MTDWTLAQATAWIAFRDEAAMQMASAASTFALTLFDKERSKEEDEHEDGWLSGDSQQGAGSNVSPGLLRSAWSDLRSALQSGAIRSRGVSRSGDLRDLASLEWNPRVGRLAPNLDEDQLRRRNAGVEVVSVFVVAEEIRQRWPEPGARRAGTNAPNIRDLMRLAVEACFPDGVPIGFKVKVRDNQLNAWLETNGGTARKDRQWREFFRGR